MKLVAYIIFHQFATANLFVGMRMFQELMCQKILKYEDADPFTKIHKAQVLSLDAAGDKTQLSGKNSILNIRDIDSCQGENDYVGISSSPPPFLPLVSTELMFRQCLPQFSILAQIRKNNI